METRLPNKLLGTRHKASCDCISRSCDWIIGSEKPRWPTARCGGFPGTHDLVLLNTWEGNAALFAKALCDILILRMN